MESVFWYKVRKAVARGPGVCAVGGSGPGLGDWVIIAFGSCGIGSAEGIVFVVRRKRGLW